MQNVFDKEPYRFQRPERNKNSATRQSVKVNRELIEQLEAIQRRAEAMLAKDFSDAETVKPEHLGRKFATEEAISEDSYRSHDERSMLRRIQIERTEIRRIRDQISTIPTTIRLQGHNHIEESTIVRLQDELSLAKEQLKAKQQQLTTSMKETKEVEWRLSALNESESKMYDQVHDFSIGNSVLLISNRQNGIKYRQLKQMRDLLMQSKTDAQRFNSTRHLEKERQLKGCFLSILDIKNQLKVVNAQAQQQKQAILRFTRLLLDYKEKVIEQTREEDAGLLQQDRQMLKRVLQRNSVSHKERLHTNHYKRLPILENHRAPIPEESLSVSSSRSRSSKSGGEERIFRPVMIERVVRMKSRASKVKKPEISSDEDLFQPKKIRKVEQRPNISMTVAVDRPDIEGPKPYAVDKSFSRLKNKGGLQQTQYKGASRFSSVHNRN